MSLVLDFLGKLSLRNEYLKPRPEEGVVQQRAVQALAGSRVVCIRIRPEFVKPTGKAAGPLFEVPVMSSEVRDLISERLKSFLTEGEISFALVRETSPTPPHNTIVKDKITFKPGDQHVVSVRSGLLLLENPVGRYMLEEVPFQQTVVESNMRANLVDDRMLSQNHAQEQIAFLQRQAVEQAKLIKNLKANAAEAAFSAAAVTDDAGGGRAEDPDAQEAQDKIESAPEPTPSAITTTSPAAPAPPAASKKR